MIVGRAKTIMKCLRQLGNILLTVLLVFFGLYTLLLHYRTSVLITLYNKMGWALMIGTKESGFNHLLQRIIMIVIITIGAWYGYKKENNSLVYWVQILSIAVILSFRITAMF